MAIHVQQLTEYSIVAEPLPEHMKVALVTLRNKASQEIAKINRSEWEAQSSKIYSREDYEEVTEKKSRKVQQEVPEISGVTPLTLEQLQLMGHDALKEHAMKYSIVSLPKDKTLAVQEILKAQNGELARKD